MTFSFHDDSASQMHRSEPTPGLLRRNRAGADLWWQRTSRPAVAASADPVLRTDSELLPTVMVGSAIVVFKLFMLGLLIYAI